jgi:putative photosynthetic complex assembly protein
MSDPFANHPPSRVPLYGAVALVAFVIAATIIIRFTNEPSTPSPAPILVERDLRFEDRSDGAIVVIDARSATVVEVVSPGADGFIRGTMRALARERRRNGDGPEQSFRLTAGTDGSLTLTDPVTQQRVDLLAFGPTNSAAFARLLRAAPPTQLSVKE